MADFTRYSNYNENESFSGVVFGAHSPLLEVEQNEIQQIVDTKLKRISSVLGNTIIPMSDGNIVFSGSTLSLSNCVVLHDGFTAFIPSAKVNLSDSNKYAYVKLEEKTVTGNMTLKSYGNTQGSNVINTIIDNRSKGVETSRRRMIEVTLMSGASVPSETDAVKYVTIGEYNSGKFVFTAVKDTVEDLGLSVVNGALCYTFEE